MVPHNHRYPSPSPAKIAQYSIVGTGTFNPESTVYIPASRKLTIHFIPPHPLPIPLPTPTHPHPLLSSLVSACNSRDSWPLEITWERSYDINFLCPHPKMLSRELKVLGGKLVVLWGQPLSSGKSNSASCSAHLSIPCDLTIAVRTGSADQTLTQRKRLKILPKTHMRFSNSATSETAGKAILVSYHTRPGALYTSGV
jgi:hypothetical protein